MGKPTTKLQLKKQINPVVPNNISKLAGMGKKQPTIGTKVVNATQNVAKNALRRMVFSPKMEKQAKSILFTTPTPTPKPKPVQKPAPKVKRGAFRA